MEEFAVLAAMAARYRGQETGDPAVVGWDIATPDGVRSYQMTMAGAACTVAAGAAVRPRVMLGVGSADLRLLAAGEAGWVDLFMAGRLRLSGDLAFARALEGQFRGGSHTAEGLDHEPR